MLASITPLGERGRHQKWPLTVAFYLVGSTLGGAALGTVAALAGSLVRRVAHPSGPVALAVIALAALGAVAIDSRRWGPVPSIRRQVNEDWLNQYRSWVYGIGFGLQLGAGLLTVVTSASTYLLVVVAVLSPTPGLAVALGTAYGVARALPIVLTARVRTFPQLGELHRRVSSWQPRAGRLTLATELLIALVAVAWAFR